MGSSPEIAFKSLSLERKDVVSAEGAGGVGVQEGGKIGLGRASERASDESGAATDLVL